MNRITATAAALAVALGTLGGATSATAKLPTAKISCYGGDDRAPGFVMCFGYLNGQYKGSCQNGSDAHCEGP